MSPARQFGQILLRKTPTVVPISVAGISTTTTSYAIRWRCGTRGCLWGEGEGGGEGEGEGEGESHLSQR